MGVVKHPANLTYWPLALTGYLFLWTLLVSPYSRYGDYWAFIPAFIVFPLAVVLHFIIAKREKWRSKLVLYGIAHLSFLFVVWVWCLMVISKDSF